MAREQAFINNLLADFPLCSDAPNEERKLKQSVISSSPLLQLTIQTNFYSRYFKKHLEIILKGLELILIRTCLKIKEYRLHSCIQPQRHRSLRVTSIIHLCCL